MAGWLAGWLVEGLLAQVCFVLPHSSLLLLIFPALPCPALPQRDELQRSCADLSSAQLDSTSLVLREQLRLLQAELASHKEQLQAATEEKARLEAACQSLSHGHGPQVGHCSIAAWGPWTTGGSLQ